MRCWLALLLVAVPAQAFVVDEPGIYHACPKGKTWDDVAKCLATQGRPAMLQQVAGARLVRVDQRENGVWVDGGVYLYAESPQGWQVAGSFFGRDTAYEVQALAPVTIGTHAGYRIEIAQASTVHVQLEDATTRPATRRMYQTLFCSPQGRYCAQAIRTCEVLVRGRALWAFRGAVTIDGLDVKVTGDRSHAGLFCEQTERVQLGWPQKP